MFGYFGRIPYVGETYVEYPSVTYGRRWFDTLITLQDAEVWFGRFHITVSIIRKPVPLLVALAAAGAYALHSVASA